MATKTKKVVAANVKAVAAITEPGRWKVVGEEGLYIQWMTETRRSWIMKYNFRGKAREDGLGSLATVSLADARTKAKAHRHEIAQGRDPRGEAAPVAPVVKARTFKEAAEDYITRKTPEWLEPKMPLQWRATLATYAYPKIGDTACNEITTTDVHQLLEEIWTTKTETATRVQQRIKEVLAAEFVRSGKTWTGWSNPATWDGNLKHLLPAPSKIHTVEHHKAVHWREAPAAYAKIAQGKGTGALALRFTILTAARSKMTRLATWGEIDLDSVAWRVPEHRTVKGKKQGSGTKGGNAVIPLSTEVVKILSQAQMMQRQDGLVFPGGSPGKAISDMTMLMAIYRAGIDCTTHGWRRTFSTWSAEWLGGNLEQTEVALCHEIKGVRGIYMSGDLLGARRLMMAAWAAYLTGTQEEAEAAREAYRNFRPR